MSLIDKLKGRAKRVAGSKKKREDRIEPDGREGDRHEFETWNRAKAPGRSSGRSPFG